MRPDRWKWVVFVLGLLLLAGCADVTSSNGFIVLRYKAITIPLLIGLGALLSVGGVISIIKFLPKRWRQQQGLYRKMKSALRIITIPIIGIGLLIAVVPFAWYRVEVGKDYIRINEFPNKNYYTRDQIESIEVIPGDTSRRLHIKITEGSEYFVNESEIGSDSFNKIADSALILASNNSPKQYTVFNYEDFGPQAMAWEDIGMQWWQWDDHGDSDPNYKYDIKVVVYRNMPLSQIKSLYPIDEAKKKDFRYFEYHDAIKYLDENIKELKHEKEEWAINLRQHLIETKDRIQREIKMEN